jgi:hypothetical protein
MNNPAAKELEDGEYASGYEDETATKEQSAVPAQTGNADDIEHIMDDDAVRNFCEPCVKFM